MLVISIVCSMTPAVNKSISKIPKDTRIILARTACFGSCPIYKLTISANGCVVFEGKRFVKKVGTFKSKISRAQLQQLIAEFENIQYFSLRDQYTTQKDGCELATDNPSVITSLKINGKSKTVIHYHGCRGVKKLEELTKLEDQIDKIAGSSRWVGN